MLSIKIINELDVLCPILVRLKVGPIRRLGLSGKFPQASLVSAYRSGLPFHETA